MKLCCQHFIWSTALVLMAYGSLVANQEDDLARRSSWQPPNASAQRQIVSAWLESQQDNLPAATKNDVTELWSDLDDMAPAQVVIAVIESAAKAYPGVAEVYQLCERPRAAIDLPEIVIFDDRSVPVWARHNLQLHYGIWLANQQLYDEASEQLNDLQWNDVADPASLLFYQSLVLHRRLDKAACLATLSKLLENEAKLPRRYSAVAKLMQADLEPLETDSLDEISRIMDSVKVRLGHGRAGKRVRQQEADVIAKLDKLIENLEEQASSSASGNGGGTSAPSQPMQDSMPGGGSGPGNVDPKKLGTNTNWGDLPPKEREEALQQLGRDLPSHYRSVIEEYFRKLATEGE